MNLNVDIHPGVLDSLFLLSKLEASNLQKEKKPWPEANVNPKNKETSATYSIQLLN